MSSPKRCLVYEAILILLAVVVCPVAAFPFVGLVSEVIEGDFMEVFDGIKLRKVRLYGIDAPELNQRFGNESVKFLEELVHRRNVNVEVITEDIYGRAVALVTLGGKNINEIMIRDGYAWVYEEHCNKSECQQWRREQDQARALKKNIWSEEAPQPPWECRHTTGDEGKGIREYIEPYWVSDVRGTGLAAESTRVQHSSSSKLSHSEQEVNRAADRASVKKPLLHGTNKEARKGLVSKDESHTPEESSRELGWAEVAKINRGDASLSSESSVRRTDVPTERPAQRFQTGERQSIASRLSELSGGELATLLAISFLMTWGVGLTPPLLIRYVFLRRPMGKRAAVLVCAMLWAFNFVFFQAMGSTSKYHGALILVALVSYWILCRGKTTYSSESATAVNRIKGLSMGNQQRLVLFATAAVLVLMLLFPPFHEVRSTGTFNWGYHFILSSSSGTVNVGTLAIQCLIVVLVGAICWFALRDRTANQIVEQTPVNHVEPSIDPAKSPGAADENPR